MIETIRQYKPCCEQEARDRTLMLDYLSHHENAFSRENPIAHVTASAWVTNAKRDKVLLIYHKLYDSWAWTGGHADGERDLLSVALRECREETGIIHVRPVTGEIFSLEVLTVDGHEKRGVYVPSHLHLNVSYLLEADERDTLCVCEAENSGVRWFSLEEALTAPNEPWMLARVYRKLNAKLAAMT